LARLHSGGAEPPSHLPRHSHGVHAQRSYSRTRPPLSHHIVRYRPESRLRHWCASTSLPISPLHVEFHSPLLHSSLPVSNDRLRLSRKISHQTSKTACARFTPNNSGQRSPPTYYRGCWHVVSRGFLIRYRQGTAVLGLY